MARMGGTSLLEWLSRVDAMTTTLSTVIEDVIAKIFSEIVCHTRDEAQRVKEAAEIIRDMTEGLCLRPITPARGEPMPQTVEACQSVMERDAELILEMKAEISKLKQKVNTLSQKIQARQGASE